MRILHGHQRRRSSRGGFSSGAVFRSHAAPCCFAKMSGGGKESHAFPDPHVMRAYLPTYKSPNMPHSGELLPCLTIEARAYSRGSV